MELIGSMTFEEYLDWYIAHERTFEQYFLMDGLVPSNSRFARAEQFEQDSERILNVELGLGVDVRIPGYRASQHAPYLSYLGPEAIGRINRKYAWVFGQPYPEALICP